MTNAIQSTSTSRRIRRRCMAVTLLAMMAGCVAVDGLNWRGPISFPVGFKKANSQQSLGSVWDVQFGVQGFWGDPTLQDPKGMYYRFYSDYLTVENDSGVFFPVSQMWNYTDLGTDAAGVRRSRLHSRCNIRFNRDLVDAPNGHHYWEGLRLPCTIELTSTPLSPRSFEHKIVVTIQHEFPDQLPLRITLRASEPNGSIGYQ